MEERKLTIDEVIKYAELMGYAHRAGPSRAKNYAYTFWETPHYDKIMVLYEGEKRTLRGRSEPEVCWICLHKDGSITSIPSRYFRTHYIQLKGFPLTDEAKQKIYNIIDKEAE